MTQVHSSEPAEYIVDTPLTMDEAAILASAWEIIRRRARVPGQLFSSPGQVKDFLCMANAQEQDQARERFGVMFLMLNTH